MFKRIIIISIAGLGLFGLQGLNKPGHVSAQAVCQICAPVGNTSEYFLCTSQPPGSFKICGSPPYACCYSPPACIVPAQFTCPSAPTPGPTLPPGAPTPTIITSLPPEIDPYCGGHWQQCCGIQPNGDPSFGECDPQPTNEPNLYCISLIGGESGCCLQSDPEPRCQVGPPSNNPSVFCDASGHPSPLVSDRIYTAFGCLSINAPTTISQLLDLLTKLSGGFALLLIIVAGVQIATAGGNPRQVQAGKELISAVVAGLVLLALSVVILNFSGVNVLGLHNLGFRT